jgi:hypothetical protein
MEAIMEWVMVYLTMINAVPVLGAGDNNYKTKEECIEDNFGGTDDTFWCVPRTWLDNDQRRPVRAFVTD